MSGAANAPANPAKGRWALVAAAQLLQLSIDAVNAWSVFSSARQEHRPSDCRRWRPPCRLR